MEDDDSFGVPSEPDHDVEGAIVASCTTCDKLLTAAHRIVNMSTQKRDHGVKPRQDKYDLVPVCEIGGLSNILADRKCDRHQAFFRSSSNMRKSEEILWAYSKNIKVKAYWDADKDRAVLAEEDILRSGRFDQEILLLDCGPQLSIAPCIGRPRDESFISIELVRQWISSCEMNHQTSCCVPTAPSLTLSWLIDTTTLCLVPAKYNTQYITLSYVWGQTEMLKTTRETLRTLQAPGALSANSHLRVPPVIRHAISLASQLGERHIWIDSLCILQDDHDSLDHHVRHMASIFETARFTIVAADGVNADHGILGIKGVSGPRTLPCPLRLSNRFELRSRGYLNILDSAWGRRGWTLQEHIFSKRKLVFVHGSAQWICQESRCFEDICQVSVSNRKRRRRDYDMEQELESVGELALKYPVISELEGILRQYTERNLTFKNDTIRAIDAVFTAYGGAYPSGFFLGLPVDFFDMALLWRHAYSDADHSRTCATRSPSTQSSFPSWTWAGWVGALRVGAWRAATYIKDADEHSWVGKRCYTIPMLEWRYLSDSDGTERPILGLNNAHAYKLRFMAKKDGLPPGWKYEREPSPPIQGANTSEHANVQDDTGQQVSREYYMYESEIPTTSTLYFYSHDSAPGIKFWHPVPISTGRQESVTTPLNGRILCARTQSGRLWATASKRPTLVGDESKEGNYRVYVPL